MISGTGKRWKMKLNSNTQWYVRGVLLMLLSFIFYLSPVPEIIRPQKSTFITIMSHLYCYSSTNVQLEPAV